MPTNRAYTVGVSFDVVTDESAAHGDFARSGWTEEPSALTLRDALRVVQEFGPLERNAARYFDGLTHVSLYQADGHTNYRTGHVTRHCVHVTATPRNLARLLKLAKLL